MWQTVVSLYHYSSAGSDAQLLATTLLLKQLPYSGQTSDDQYIYPSTRIDISDFGMHFDLKIAEGIAVVGNETQITIYVEAIKR